MDKYQKEVEQAKLDAELQQVKALKAEYERAAKEIQQKIKLINGKLNVLLKDFDSLDDKQRSIIQSQIYQKDYQEALKKQIDDILDGFNEKEYKSINQYLKDGYEISYTGTMYDISKQGIPLVIPIDQKAVARAMTNNTKLSVSLYKKLGINAALLNRQIQSTISRGIAMGDSYNIIARNLNNDSNVGFNRAMRIARTEGHRVQMEATNDAQHVAKDAGADIVKQWDATLDGRTRPLHRELDGQIRELDEPFEVGGLEVMYPSAFGRAAQDINCRCVITQRAKWALDDDELARLKERAEYFGLDKANTFEAFKEKYLNAEILPKKKEYLTEKKLMQKLAETEKNLDELKNAFYEEVGITFEDAVKNYGGVDKMITVLESNLQAIMSRKEFEEWKLKILAIKSRIEEAELNIAKWQKMLDKKLAVKEIKKLKKEKIEIKNDLAKLQDELDNFEIKTYSNIWKEDVTTADYAAKMAGIEGKKKYFEEKIIMATSPEDAAKWQKLYLEVKEFESEGAKYYKLQQSIKQAEQKLKNIDKDILNIQKNGIISKGLKSEAFSQERKDAAYWFTNANGGVKGADGVLRDKAGEVWRNATQFERDSIYEYTFSYHKFNEPLRGIEYGTNKYLGVGNVNLDEIGVNYSGFKRGEVKKLIDAMTSIIEKSTYDSDIWVQRGCDYSGMDKFFGIDPSDFNLPEAELAAKLVGSEPTEHGFLSTGVSKGSGFSSKPIIMNIYAPSGTKMMYAEPFSAFGNGDGKNWDGLSKQSSFGSEAEMIFQRGTTFRITKVEKSNGNIYIDMEVIEQEKF